MNVYLFGYLSILDPENTLIVEDTLEDVRFFDNPLVVNDPKIRFYAGHPLTTNDGKSLGTLCVIGMKPQSLSETQKRALRVLANQVMIQIELAHMLKLADENKEYVSAIVNTIVDGIITINSKGGNVANLTQPTQNSKNIFQI